MNWPKLIQLGNKLNNGVGLYPRRKEIKIVAFIRTMAQMVVKRSHDDWWRVPAKSTPTKQKGSLANRSAYATDQPHQYTHLLPFFLYSLNPPNPPIFANKPTNSNILNMPTVKYHSSVARFDLSVLPNKEKVELVLKAQKSEGGPELRIKLRELVHRYQAPYSTCRDRIFSGAVSKKESTEAQQRLLPAEEDGIIAEILQLGAWGWPPLIPMVMRMGQEVYDLKGENNKLYKNQYIGFLDRYRQLRAQFIPPLNKERALAKDPDIIRAYFELYRTTKDEFCIHNNNVYNMNEKGCIIGVISKNRAIVERKAKDAYIIQPGNQEWVSLIECICLTRRLLSGWAIFKRKNIKKEWLEHFLKSFVYTLKRGQTDNKLCVKWFKLCFKLETKRVKKG